MPTPDSWHEKAAEIIEREKRGAGDVRPPFSDRPLNHIPNGNDGCRHCPKPWSMHSIQERVLR